MNDASGDPGLSNPKRHPIQTRFAYVSHKEASGAKVAMSSRREASQIYIKQLSLTEKQNDDVRALYQRGEIYSKKFDPQSAEEQMAAASLLAEIALDEESRGLLCNQWSKRWSSRSGGSGNTTTRVLYQWYVKDLVSTRKRY